MGRGLPGGDRSCARARQELGLGEGCLLSRTTGTRISSRALRTAPGFALEQLGVGPPGNQSARIGTGGWHGDLCSSLMSN